MADVTRKVEMALKKAWTLVEAKQLDLGLKAFDEAIAADRALRPKYTEALKERALLLRDLGRSKEAWTHAVDAIKAAGEASMVDLLCAAGDIALDLGQGADALKLAEKSLEKSKDNP